MNRLMLLVCLSVWASTALAGEKHKVAGTNTYMLQEKQWPVGGNSVFWTLDNVGTVDVKVSPLDFEAVECHGAGFWDWNGSRGEGICIFGEGSDKQVWAWKAEPGRKSTWKIIHATGKYTGITGSGTHTTRTDDNYRVQKIRITDWQGEIELPE